MDHYNVVLDFFKNAAEPVHAGKVAEGTGVDRKEVDKIMKKLKKWKISKKKKKIKFKKNKKIQKNKIRKKLFSSKRRQEFA